MTPKKMKDADVSGYTHLGKHHWKAFVSATGKFDPGKANFKPRLEMLSPKGMTKRFYDHKEETSIDVHYDDEYVYDYYYQRLILTMGWMDNGKVDEAILQLFFTKLLDYCNTIEGRKQQALIREQAISLAKQFPHKTLEQWEAELMGGVNTDNGVQHKGFGDEKNILATKDETSQNEISDVDAITAETEDRAINMDDDNPDTEEDCGDSESVSTKNTTEVDTPIVPSVTPKKRGRPRKVVSTD